MAGPNDRSPSARAPRRDEAGSAIRSERLEAALERAALKGDHAELFELMSRSSGLPGPRPNLDLARVLGRAIAGYAGRGDRLLRTLAASDAEYPRIVAALALEARALAGVDPRGADLGLQEIAEDPRNLVRIGVVEALRLRIARAGEAAVTGLAAWTDGYLQAHVALEALAHRPTLDALPEGAPVLERLEEAFALADEAPRAADRSQGVRTLRAGLPAQITAFAARFPGTLAWLEVRARASRPESREIIAEAIRALRRSQLSDAEAGRLSGALDASAPVPRDAARLVQGTRKRSKGRR
jgi:hypothetical protein